MISKRQEKGASGEHQKKAKKAHAPSIADFKLYKRRHARKRGNLLLLMVILFTWGERDVLWRTGPIYSR